MSAGSKDIHWRALSVLHAEHPALTLFSEAALGLEGQDDMDERVWAW